MKSEFKDLGETRKNVVIEVPSDDVDQEIERLSQHHRRSVRLPGFRKGKAPARLIWQRMREQILHEVADSLIPQAIEEALQTRGVQPVDTPTVRDVNIEQGEPLTFTATFETLPPVEPGEYRGLTVRRNPIDLTDENVSKALEQLRERSAKLEPVEGRTVAVGDTVTVDLERRIAPRPKSQDVQAPQNHHDIKIEIGAAGNPTGFDEHVVGLEAGESAKFTVSQPENPDVSEGRDSRDQVESKVEYSVSIKEIHQRVLPDLNDSFARELGTCETLETLKEQVMTELREQAERDTDRKMRDSLLIQLATRIPGAVPEVLINREIDRRVEHLVTQLVAQKIDPRQANINWEEFRENQRAAATDTVKSTLVLDEIAEKEKIEVVNEELTHEIERLATRSNRTVSATRALLEKEGSTASLAVGIRREKVINLVLEHAAVVTA